MTHCLTVFVVKWWIISITIFGTMEMVLVFFMDLVQQRIQCLLLCCHVTVTACSIHQEEQNCEISRVEIHAMMTLLQVYTNTKMAARDSMLGYDINLFTKIDAARLSMLWLNFYYVSSCIIGDFSHLCGRVFFLCSKGNFGLYNLSKQGFLFQKSINPC